MNLFVAEYPGAWLGFPGAMTVDHECLAVAAPRRSDTQTRFR